MILKGKESYSGRSVGVLDGLNDIGTKNMSPRCDNISSMLRNRGLTCQGSSNDTVLEKASPTDNSFRIPSSMLLNVTTV